MELYKAVAKAIIGCILLPLGMAVNCNTVMAEDTMETGTAELAVAMNKEAYDEILSRYVSMVREQEVDEEIKEAELDYLYDESEYCIWESGLLEPEGDYCVAQDYYYALFDINEDGQEELLVGYDYDDPRVEVIIIDIWSVIEGSPKLVYSVPSIEDDVELCEEGLLKEEQGWDAEEATSFMKLQTDGNLQVIQTVGIVYYDYENENDTIPRYYKGQADISYSRYYYSDWLESDDPQNIKELEYNDILTAHKVISTEKIGWINLRDNEPLVYQEKSQQNEVLEWAEVPDDYIITKTGSFTNGLAWIEFERHGTSYSGVINKSGKVLFYLADSPDSMSDFYDGYAFIEYDYGNDFLYVINDKGEILSSYSYQMYEDNCEYPEARGRGYVLTTEHVAGFDANEYIYRVYDPNGTEILKRTERNPLRTVSVGNGVFLIDGTGFRNGKGSLYFAKDDMWLDLTKDTQYMHAYEGYEHEILFLGIEDGSKFSYVSKEKTIETVNIPGELSGDIKFRGEDEGILLFEKKENCIYVFDTHTHLFQKYEGRYKDRMDWDSAGCVSYINDGIIALELRGADSKQYVGLIDYQFNELCDPILGNEFSFGGGAISVYDFLRTNLLGVYDYSGNELAMMDYAHCEGIIATEAEYRNYDGTAAFKEIDFSDAKVVDPFSS